MNKNNKDYNKFKKNILNYINHLKLTSFKGWHEEAINGYLTACISIEEKIKNIK